MRYHIRAEFPENKCEDFHIDAPDLDKARERAESRIERQVREQRTHAYEAMLDARAHDVHFEWRGQVVFVDRAP